MQIDTGYQLLYRWVHLAVAPRVVQLKRVLLAAICIFKNIPYFLKTRLQNINVGLFELLLI